MTTLDFLYKVQYRGRLENPRQAKQAIESVFTVLKVKFAHDSFVLFSSLSDDIKVLWKTTVPFSGGKDWYSYLESEMLTKGLVVNTREVLKAVLLTLRESVDKTSARKISKKLPEELRMYLAGC